MRHILLLLTCTVAVLNCGCGSESKNDTPTTSTSVSAQQSPASDPHEDDGTFSIGIGAVDPLEYLDSSTQSDATGKESVSLFDGKTLDGWEIIEFGGEGEVSVSDGAIQMQSGDPLTGICVSDEVELPNANYEVSLEGMKLGGSDFFCALTFPVNDSFCTLVVGGWGGTLVGLSNLDGEDASENRTKLNKKFEKNRWYAIRVKVLPERITCWIDDEKLIDESIEGVEVSIRNDVISTTPLGITNFITTSSIRNIQIRKLD